MHLMTWLGVRIWTTEWCHLKQIQFYSAALIKHKKKEVQVKSFNPCVLDSINTNFLDRRICWDIKAHCNEAITCSLYIIWGKNYIVLVSGGGWSRFFKSILRRIRYKKHVPVIFVGLKAVNRNKRWTEFKKLRSWSFFHGWQTQVLKLE